jgi:hypothetical protein
MDLYMKYLIGIIFLFMANVAYAFSYTKEFTEVELQEKVEGMMPLEKKKFFVTVIITEPKLDLIEGSNEFGIQTHIEAIAPGGIKGNGLTNITGSISYKPDEGAFYMDNPVIVDLKINGIAEKYHPKIKKIAQAIVSKFLSSRPVYKLRDDNLKHKLAKATLDSVLVQNEKLLVTLSVF